MPSPIIPEARIGRRNQVTGLVSAKSVEVEILRFHRHSLAEWFCRRKFFFWYDPSLAKSSTGKESGTLID